MEAWDDGPRVRPIPLDDDAHDRDEPSGAHPAGSRSWVPVTLTITAVAVAVASVALFGTLRFDDPPPAPIDEAAAETPEDAASTTTAAPLPPRLDELLPGVTDRLTLMAVRDGTLNALLWDPSFREPKPIPLDIEETPGARFTGAAFDRSGRLVVVERCSNLRCDLYGGAPTELGTTPDVTGTLGFTWHGSEVGRLAWVAPSGAGYDIVTGRVNPLSGGIDDTTDQFTIDEPVRLVRWDRLGFVLQSTGSVTRTIGVDPEGAVLWDRPGQASTATERIVAISNAVPADDGEQETDALAWSLVDRTTGESIPDGDTIAPAIVFVGASESADLVGRLSARDTGPYSLRVSGGELSAQRVVTIQQRYEPIGFTDDGAYFVLLGDAANIVFVAWNQGSSHEVAVPDGFGVLGLDLG